MPWHRFVPTALRQLLCEKHLYQYVEVDLRPMLEVSNRINMELSGPGGLRERVARPPNTIKGIQESKDCSVHVPWTIGDGHLGRAFSDMVQFALPFHQHVLFHLRESAAFQSYRRDVSVRS
jgi:hypothetical protein